MNVLLKFQYVCFIVMKDLLFYWILLVIQKVNSEQEWMRQHFWGSHTLEARHKAQENFAEFTIEEFKSTIAK